MGSTILNETLCRGARQAGGSESGKFNILEPSVDLNGTLDGTLTLAPRTVLS